MDLPFIMLTNHLCKTADWPDSLVEPLWTVTTKVYYSCVDAGPWTRFNYDGQRRLAGLVTWIDQSPEGHGEGPRECLSITTGYPENLCASESHFWGSNLRTPHIVKYVANLLGKWIRPRIHTHPIDHCLRVSEFHRWHHSVLPLFVSVTACH